MNKETMYRLPQRASAIILLALLLAVLVKLLPLMKQVLSATDTPAKLTIWSGACLFFLCLSGWNQIRELIAQNRPRWIVSEAVALLLQAAALIWLIVGPWAALDHPRGLFFAGFSLLLIGGYAWRRTHQPAALSVVTGGFFVLLWFSGFAAAIAGG